MNSTIKSKDEHFSEIKASIRWDIANISASFSKKYLKKNNYIKIHYEDYVKNPDETFKELGEFLGLNFSEVVSMLENGDNIPLVHQIDGNGIRKKHYITLDRQIGFKWKKELPMYKRMIHYIISWPFILYYKNS